MNNFYYEWPLILIHKKVFFIYCLQWMTTFHYTSLQKYFVNNQWHKEKTFKHSFIISKLL